MIVNRESRASVVALLFVLSGSLGLIYQIVWFKYLSLFLGNTTYAQTIVLATFMGGLAIGSALWGRESDRLARPLMLYGWLEVGIGVYCLLYPTLLDGLRSAFVGIVQSSGWESGSTGVLMLKLGVSLTSLLVPTILMGGTLPVLVRTLSHTLREAGRTVAVLYFLNSFGAVVGSLLAGFFFIRLVGLESTVYSSAVFNLLVGAVAIVVGRRSEEPEPSAPSQSKEDVGSPYTIRQVKVAIIVAGLSGCAAMIYEVSWVRMLIPVLGSSTYSFSLMLVAFISGITLGSMIVAGRIAKVKDLVPWLAGTQMGVALSLLVTLPVFGMVPYLFWKTAHMLTRSEATYPLFLFLQFLLGCALMIVPTVFMGMTLPIAMRIASRSMDRLGRSAGFVYAVNTVGTVVGALAAGLVLFPAVGVQRTTEIGIILNAAAAVIVLVFSVRVVSRKLTYILGTFGVLVGMGFALAPEWNRSTMLTGVFRLINKNTPPPESFPEFVERYEPSDVLYYKEGTTATVGVVESPTPEGMQNVLIINGKSDASSRGDLPTQVLLGQLPSMFHPNPKNALVIGYGSGVTAGSILRHPIDRLDCVEISPEVVEASEHFSHVNNRPMDDPRTHMHVEDALAYLKLTSHTYDIVVSEPSNPWIAGIGNLYTREFFEQCRSKMGADGIMVQWFHLYEIDDEMLRLVLRTFASVFPHVTLWEPMAADIILVGSNSPLEVTDAKLAAAMKAPGIKSDLERIMIRDPVTLLTLQVMSDRTVRTYAGEGRLNTEDLPLLEYGAPQAFFVNRGASKIDDNDDRIRASGPETYLLRRLREKPMTAQELLNAGRLHASPMRGHPLLAYFFLAEYLKKQPKDARAVAVMADVLARLRKPVESLAYRKLLTELTPRDPKALERYAWEKFESDLKMMSAMAALNTAEPERLLHKSVELTKDTVDLYRVRLADILYSTGRYRQSLDQYMRALEIREIYEPDQYIPQDQILLRVAQCFYHLNDRQRAAGYALQANWANPRNTGARDLINQIWLDGGGGVR